MHRSSQQEIVIIVTLGERDTAKDCKLLVQILPLKHQLLFHCFLFVMLLLFLLLDSLSLMNEEQRLRVAKKCQKERETKLHRNQTAEAFACKTSFRSPNDECFDAIEGEGEVSQILVIKSYEENKSEVQDRHAC